MMNDAREEIFYSFVECSITKEWIEEILVRIFEV